MAKRFGFTLSGSATHIERLQSHIKCGFTLSDVLVTLLIIGIVAILTIPQLINSTNMQELKTSFKKEFSAIAGATNAIIQDNGGVASGAFGTTNLEFLTALATKMNFTQTCNSGVGVCWHPANVIKFYDGNTDSGDYSGNCSARSIDGALWSLQLVTSDCSNSPSSPYGGRCAAITVDVNGFKGPNMYGVDIFRAEITQIGASPSGQFFYSGNCSKNDHTGRSGYGCAVNILNNTNY